MPASSAAAAARQRSSRQPSRVCRSSCGSRSSAAALHPVTLLFGSCRPVAAQRILREATTLGVEAIAVFGADKAEPSYLKASLWSPGGWREHLVAGAAQAFTTLVPAVSVFESLDAAVAAAAAAARPGSARDRSWTGRRPRPRQLRSRPAAARLGAGRGQHPRGGRPGARLVGPRAASPALRGLQARRSRRARAPVRDRLRRGDRSRARPTRAAVGAAATGLRREASISGEPRTGWPCS